MSSRCARDRGAVLGLASGLALLLCLLGPSLLFAQSAADYVRQGKAVLELGNEEAMKEARANFEQALRVDEENYEAAWRLAEVQYYLWEAGAGWESEGLQRSELLRIARRGVQSGQLAVHLNPDGVEGLFWVSANLAVWGLTQGVLDSLAQVPTIVRHTERCIELDPEGRFERGGCYRIAAPIYSRVPGFPVSIGDRQKAEKYFEKTMLHGSDYPINHNLWAEHYLSIRKPEKAVEVLEKGIAVMENRASVPDPDRYAYWDRRDMQRAQELLQEAKDRL